MDRPTTSATATVCPVASTIEITLKIRSGTAATRSKCGRPKGSRVGVLHTGPAATGEKSISPKAAAKSVPASRPSSTASWPSIPLNRRANSSVKPMVASARPMFTGSPKVGVPALPAMMPP